MSQRDRELASNKLYTMRQNRNGDWELVNVDGNVENTFRLSVHFDRTQAECKRSMDANNARLNRLRDYHRRNRK